MFLLNLQELASENWKQSHEDIRHREECERKQNQEKLYFFDIFFLSPSFSEANIW